MCAHIIMPNHWYLLLKTHYDGDLALFLQILTQGHTQIVHHRVRTIGTGHLYQGRYESFVVEGDAHFITVLCYIERNAVHAGLVQFSEGWQWGSGFHRVHNTTRASVLSTELPVDVPPDYTTWTNDPTGDIEAEIVRTR